MEEAAERDFIRRAADSIESTTGQRPAGWLSRYLQSGNTRRLLAEEGFLYHMDDFSSEAPFWDHSGPKPIIILPYQLDTNDMKLWSDPAYTPRAWLDYLIDSFDQLYEEGAGMLSVGIHLRITGRPGRAKNFAKFLQHITSRPQTWIATRLEIAQHFAAQS
jgi:peptidoglycan/xylan/chitin deacetylase (PgdA/CDA1 family)